MRKIISLTRHFAETANVTREDAIECTLLLVALLAFLLGT